MNNPLVSLARGRRLNVRLVRERESWTITISERKADWVWVTVGTRRTAGDQAGKAGARHGHDHDALRPGGRTSMSSLIKNHLRLLTGERYLSRSGGLLLTCSLARSSASTGEIGGEIKNATKQGCPK